MTSFVVTRTDTRPVSWIKAARKAFLAFPQGAQNVILRALTIAAEGRKADIAKPMKGFGSGVFEVAIRYRSDAFRTVYAVQLADDIWVLHAFQKKAKQGVRTPRKDLDLIRSRLKWLQMELKQ